MRRLRQRPRFIRLRHAPAREVAVVLLVTVCSLAGGPPATKAEAIAPPPGTYKLIAGQPVPVRWATAARKLPLKYKPVPPDALRSRAVELRAVRREGVSFQVSIGPKLGGEARVHDVRLQGLSHAGGDDAGGKTGGYTIGKDRIELKTVGLVRSRKTKREWPDVLFPLGTIKGVEDGYSYTLWNTIYVPAEAPAGQYTGELTMKVDRGGKTLNLRVPVKLRVDDYTLPEDVRVDTQLFSFNEGSANLWYHFKNAADRIRYTVDEVYPRYARNRISPGSFVPSSKPLYMKNKPYEADGPAGRYRSFDGSTGDGAGFKIDQTKDFSVTLLLKPVPNKEGSFLTQWGGGAKGMEWSVGKKGEVTLKFRTKTKGVETMHFALPPGKWSHLAVTVENPAGPQTTVSAYRDGKRVVRQTIPGVKPSHHGLRLGSAYRSSIRPYTGGLDEVRVYTRVLDPKALEQSKGGAQGPAQNAAFHESYDHGYSPSAVGKDYLKKWGNYWRDRGLYLNQLPVPGEWKEKRLRSFFNRMSSVIKPNGWGAYLYTRLPYDEATHGKKARRNQTFSRLLEKAAPGILRLQTFGGGLARNKNPIKKVLEPYAGLVDVWCSVPGHYLKPDASAVKRWLYRRRDEHDEQLSWYIHRNIPVGNKYKKFYTAMDLRGFFWRMFQENVHMCALWSTTNWNRKGGKHGHRDLKRVKRGFALTPSTALRTGNGMLFYPGKTSHDKILDSIRDQVIRDGIEDYQYLYEIKQHWRKTRDPRARALLSLAAHLPPRFVRYGVTVDLPPQKLLRVRSQMAAYLASIQQGSGGPRQSAGGGR